MPLTGDPFYVQNQITEVHVTKFVLNHPVGSGFTASLTLSAGHPEEGKYVEVDSWTMRVTSEDLNIEFAKSPPRATMGASLKTMIYEYVQNNSPRLEGTNLMVT